MVCSETIIEQTGNNYIHVRKIVIYDRKNDVTCTIITWKWVIILQALTHQNGQIHSNNSSANCISFVYAELPVWAFPQSHRLNLTFCLKSSTSSAFCFLHVCNVDQTQICPSSISPLGLFQGIIFNIKRLKGGDLGALNYWVGPDLKGATSDKIPLHTMIQWLPQNN